jgi:type II secretory pathway component PulJ
MSARATSRSGLTVIELVSALALFVVVLGTLLVALDAATDIWAGSASKNRTFIKARNAVEQIATDLASAFALPLLRDDGTRPPASADPSNAEKPLFIVRGGGGDQLGLYFVRQRSPSEMSGDESSSLELIAYSFSWATTNGLARYTRPVVAPQRGVWARSLSEQLEAFRNDVASLSAATNFFAPCVVDFRPLVYQPQHPSTAPVTDDKPPEPLGAKSSSADNIQLADLPDFVDIHIGFVDWDAHASGSGRTNYFTRRVTLPSASASRLP